MTRARPAGPLVAGLLIAACSQSAAPPPASAMPRPLTDTAGDPGRGRAVFVSRESGHCVLCHQVSALDAPFQGNVGPVLDGIGARLTSAELRLRVVDARRLWPETVMPSYYRTDGLRQVPDALSGQPVLTAQEVEDVVAYLATLTETP